MLTFFQICHRQMSLNTWPLPYDKPADKRGMLTPACLPHSVPSAHNTDKKPGIKQRHKNLNFYGIYREHSNGGIRETIKYYSKKTLGKVNQNFHNDNKWTRLQRKIKQHYYSTQTWESKIVDVFQYAIDQICLLILGYCHTISQQINGGCWHQRVYPIPCPQLTIWTNNRALSGVTKISSFMELIQNNGTEILEKW